MDSFSNQIDFRFSDLRSEVEDKTALWQILLKIFADFEVIVDGKSYFREPDFPIVEFVQYVNEWLYSHGDFMYISMEAGDEPLILFKKTSTNLLCPLSGSNMEEWKDIELENFRISLTNLLNKVSSETINAFGIDIREAINSRITRKSCI